MTGLYSEIQFDQIRVIFSVKYLKKSALSQKRKDPIENLNDMYRYSKKALVYLAHLHYVSSKVVRTQYHVLHTYVYDFVHTVQAFGMHNTTAATVEEESDDYFWGLMLFQGLQAF